MSTPLERIEIGVVVERVKAQSQWIDFLWRPSGVLAGRPDTAPWTTLNDDGERATFYAGPATIDLHRAETPHYRSNLASDAPALWVVLRETGAEPPYEIYLVTADPFEGEAMTVAGNNIVEPVPMPEPIRDAVAAFVAQHHVEEEFFRRKRDRANLESLARRPPAPRGDRK